MIRRPKLIEIEAAIVLALTIAALTSPFWS